MTLNHERLSIRLETSAESFDVLKDAPVFQAAVRAICELMVLGRNEGRASR